MTIDKSQGQSLTIVGLSPQSQCFAHGQLYTAMSRPRDVKNLTIMTMAATHQTRSNDYISSTAYNPHNIVWPEVFPYNNG
eukprot:scaffold15914_cov80-Cylindrotheca_fusiformis.AAC.3